LNPLNLLTPLNLVDEQRGVALFVTILATLLLTALSGALIVLTTTESAISRNHRLGVQLVYAADAGLEWASQALRQTANWNDVLAGGHQIRLRLSTSRPLLAGGFQVDLDLRTTDLQRAADRGRQSDPDAPRWQLFAHGWLYTLLDEDPVDPILYVAVWVADDGADGDGDPALDRNASLHLRAEAFGPSRAKQAVEATLRRWPRPDSGRDASALRQAQGVLSPSKHVSETAGDAPTEPIGVRLAPWRIVE